MDDKVMLYELKEADSKYRKSGDYEASLACTKNIYEIERDRGYVLGLRSELTKAVKEGNGIAYELLKEAYVLTARDSFDDFMVAMEWDRQNKFWLPRRRVLEGHFGIASKIQNFIDDESMKLLTMSMPPGTGKALANDTPILTRNGWKKHGDLVVGDEVIGMNGEFKKVIAVHPKCMLDRLVTFTNGEKIVCHERHEWLFYNRHRNKDELCETRVWEKWKLESGGVGRGHRYMVQVPRREPVQGEHKDLFDPYTLGVWLGDGANKNPRICNAEQDRAIIDKIVANGLPIRWSVKHKTTGVMYYDFNMRKQLQKYGMCHSKRKSPKHIPEEYLTASVEQRLELLAGLIDTDGNTSDRKYSISTADVELRDSIIELVSTFGWRCSVKEEKPHTSSSGVIGRRSCYRIQFTPQLYVPCVLERKQIKEFGVYRKVAVKSIEKVEPQEGNCITVEGDGMYLAGRTMLPTHNTTLIKFLIAFIMGKYPDSQNMYASYSDGMLKLMFDALESMTSSEEYNYNYIFGLGKPYTSSEYKTLSYGKKGDFPTVGLVALGGSVTGRTRANKFFITDDLVKNDEVARSPERLETLWADYNNTLTTRMIGGAREIMLGTIWSLYDPISRKKNAYEGKKGYEFISLPVCDEQGHSNFLYDCADNYTDERIAALKEALDPAIFSCLYMQKGVEKEGLAFATDRLKYYNGVLPDGEPDNIIFYGDVAWGGGDSFSAPFAYVYGNDAYIHDVLFDKGDKTITRPRLVGKIMKNKARMGRLEANSGGSEYCDEVNKLLKEQGYSMNLGSKRAAGETNKMIRIEQHQQASRDFYFLDEAHRDREYKAIMNELTTFSFTSKNLHDDAPDSLAGLCDFMYKGKSEVSIMKRIF